MEPSSFPDERSRKVHEWKEQILARYLDDERISLFDPGDGNNIFYVCDQLMVAEHALDSVSGRLDRYGSRVTGPSYQLPAGASALSFAASAAGAAQEQPAYPGMATFSFDPAKKVNIAELALELSDGRLDTVAPNHVAIGLQIRRGFPDGDPEPADAALPAMPAKVPTIGNGMKVAIIDTGFPAKRAKGLGWFTSGCEHQTLAGEIDDQGAPLRNIDELDEDDDGYLDAEAGHAVFIAGLIRRAAPSATLLFLKALNSDGIGTEFGVSRAIGYAATRGAHIVNLSLGFYTLHDATPQGLRSAVDAARAKGLVLVAAAGNDALSSPTYPAAFDDVVAVGAHDRASNEPARFSNRGPWVNVSAPGVREQSTYVPGREDPRLTRDGDADRFPEWRTTALWSGTSFACGHVSGFLAANLDADADAADLQAQAAEAMATLPGDADGLRRLVPTAAF